jgi:tetratricopeptide (TPR) repeat protein
VDDSSADSDGAKGAYTYKSSCLVPSSTVSLDGLAAVLRASRDPGLFRSLSSVLVQEVQRYADEDRAGVESSLARVSEACCVVLGRCYASAVMHDVPFLCAQVLMAIDRHKLALFAFNVSVQQEEHPATVLNIGLCYLKLRLVDSAQACFVRALDICESAGNGSRYMGIARDAKRWMRKTMRMLQRKAKKALVIVDK